MSREQDARIAEWTGLYSIVERESVCRFLNSDDKCCGVQEWNSDDWLPYEDWPWFSESLDWMASALAVVKERGLEFKFLFQLTLILNRDCGDENGNLPWPGGWHYATATAPQRAEALCRTIVSASK